MTRREKIEQAAFNYINSDVVSPENMQLAFGDFINGAEWADKTIIEKACEWLDQNVVKYESGTRMGYIPFSFIEDMINDFRKAMED